MEEQSHSQNGFISYNFSDFRATAQIIALEN